MHGIRSLCVALAIALGGVTLRGAEAPNIVLLFVDDLGWADLGYRSPGIVETPNLDRLARESVDFERCSAPTPTCSPSRATLLTGKHPVRLGFFRHIEGTPDEEFNFWPKDPARVPSRNWLGLEHVTYAEALAERGYANWFVGKWHLGGSAYHPVKQGFDLQVGTTDRGHPGSYYPDYFPDSDVLGDATEQYLTDRLADEAVALIDGHDGSRPFMLSLWFYAVHSPHEGKREHVAHFKSLGHEGPFAEYLAMVKAMDEAVGRVLAALESKGIAGETAVIFTSDQGGFFPNGPLRGGKMHDTLYEGGARVPLLVKWPGVTTPAPNRSLVQLTDLFPTIVEIAGGDASRHPGLDGVSLVPALRTNAVLEREGPLFGYRAYEDLYASVRDGDWKLLAWRSGKVELYRPEEDISESRDLASEQPAIVETLKARLREWELGLGVSHYSGVQP